ncbi:hypothetical protein NDU88_004783 [Pleurodeles waltl]|uniref:Uncharacterized protein n=1 Tax=Pleurodeles waltl TaxID=8319 RepID=A0AAV7UK27_PLEWA|nr:hypothetical protein NDU88_004783 [Pleurodeles waltl]
MSSKEIRASIKPIHAITRGYGRTPWWLQPRREDPALVSPSSGLLRHYDPKNKWLRAEGVWTLLITTAGDPESRGPLLGRRIGATRTCRRSLDGGRHLIFSTGTRLETGGNAFGASRGAGCPLYLQIPEPAPGCCGAHGTAKSPVNTRLNRTHRTKGSRTRLWPPQRPRGARNRNANDFCPVAGGRIGGPRDLGPLRIGPGDLRPECGEWASGGSCRSA